MILPLEAFEKIYKYFNVITPNSPTFTSTSSTLSPFSLILNSKRPLQHRYKYLIKVRLFIALDGLILIDLFFHFLVAHTGVKIDSHRHTQIVVEYLLLTDSVLYAVPLVEGQRLVFGKFFAVSSDRSWELCDYFKDFVGH